MARNRTNVASGKDVVAVQAGTVINRPDPDNAAEDSTTTAPEHGGATTTNIRSGNARVGIQADTVTGSVVIRISL